MSPPRVLLINKFFRPGAGAETSFLQTRRLLQDRGHDVIDFAMRDDANLPSPYAAFFAPSRSYAADTPLVKRAGDALSSVYSTAARRALARLLDAHRPDVAHLHNIYHQLTLSIVDELAKRRIPIVLTIARLEDRMSGVHTVHRRLAVSPMPVRERRERRPPPLCEVIGAREHARCGRSDRLLVVAASYAKVHRFIAPEPFRDRDRRAGGGRPNEGRSYPELPA